MTREARRKQAAAYFAERAADWDRIRAMHAPEERVEAAILDLVGDAPHSRAARSRHRHRPHARADRAARRPRGRRRPEPGDAHPRPRAHRTERACATSLLRQGDIYAPPVERDAYDLVVVHQVLHFLDDPARALREAARTLRPGGRLLVVDFAAHARGMPCASISRIAGSASPARRSPRFLDEAGLVDARDPPRRARAAARPAS